MGTASWKVVIVDAHREFAESFRLAVNLDGRFQVSGVAHDGDAAAEILKEPGIDLLISDVEYPGPGVFYWAEELRRQSPSTRVVIVTALLSAALVEQALRSALHGYLLKSEPIPKLLDDLARIARGERRYSTPVERLLTTDEAGRRVLAQQSPFGDLTSRQIEILRHLAAGRSVKEVARLMRLSMKSVDSHKYRIMQRLNIHNRVELAHFARRKGLIVE